MDATSAGWCSESALRSRRIDDSLVQGGKWGVDGGDVHLGSCLADPSAGSADDIVDARL